MAIPSKAISPKDMGSRHMGVATARANTLTNTSRTMEVVCLLPGCFPYAYLPCVISHT